MKIREKVQAMSRRGKVAIGGAVIGLALLALTSSPVLATGTALAASSHGGTGGNAIHEQMHRMMDAVHGEGASQRMHEAMGPNSERMMEECASTMASMQNIEGMSGSGMMSNQDGR